MSLWSREDWRRYKRWLMSPLKRLEAKVRLYCQFFVLKTIEKHGIVNANSAAGLDGTTSSMILPMLQSKRRMEDNRQPAPVAVAVGGYLLTTHPRADFFYHAPVDLAQTPWILMGDYQSNVTAWICAHVKCDDRVLVLGGEQGFHTLSLATQLGERGKAMVLGFRADDKRLLELNLRANRLEHKVEVHTIKLRDLDLPNRLVRRQVAEFSPTLTIVELPAELQATRFDQERWHVVNTHFFAAGEVHSMLEPDVTGARPSIRKAA